MFTTLFFNAMARPPAARTRGGSGAVAASRRYLRIWRACRHLESLPDYLLRDIGLTRSDIRGPSMKWKF